MLLRVFEEEHEEQINHCQFTNTAHRLLLATCSNDKFLNAKVWECLFCVQMAVLLWVLCFYCLSLFQTLYFLPWIVSKITDDIECSEFLYCCFLTVSVLLCLSYCILIPVCFYVTVFSYGTSTSHPPRTQCLVTLSQSTTAVSPPMTPMCPLPLMTVQLRWVQWN